MKRIFTFSFLLFISVISFSQAGTLDKTFSGDGKTSIGFKYGGVSGGDVCKAEAIQSDGKIVLAGYSNATKHGDFNFVVMLLNTDGTLDKSFNGKGYIFIDFSGDDEASAVAIQSDGKIVVAGTTDYFSRQKFAVARLLSNGFLDISFGNFTGKVISDFGNNTIANCMAIQGNGKIIVGGAYFGSTEECILARYNSDGSFDNSFGLLGRSVTDFGSGETAHSVAIQTDGKIVIGGNSNNGDVYNYHFLVARFTSFGFLDGTFGYNGRSITEFGYDDHCTAIAIQSNGKIVAVGYTSFFTDNNYDFALARYNSNGAIDSTFGGDGKVVTNINYLYEGSDDSAYDVAIQSDGKIVVAGSTYLFGIDFALIRYNKNGTLDKTFGSNGITVTDFGYAEAAFAVKIQSNGKIVAAGTREGFFIDANFDVARYHGDNAAQEIVSGALSNKANKPGEEKLSSAHIYPNPASNILRIEGLSTSSSSTISITNVSGTVLQRATVTGSEYQFDISMLKPGMYAVNIFKDGAVQTMKFIKE